MLIFGMMRRNSEVIGGVYGALLEHLRGAFVSGVLAYGTGLVDEAIELKEFNDFTGNTVTSYACGVYVDGVLLDFYIPHLRGALREKLSLGEVVTLGRTYDGRTNISVRGSVVVSDGFGRDFSEDFLRSYVAPKVGVCLLVLTGTEYSLYIEQERDLNVLSNTFARADDVGALLRKVGRFGV